MNSPSKRLLNDPISLEKHVYCSGMVQSIQGLIKVVRGSRGVRGSRPTHNVKSLNLELPQKSLEWPKCPLTPYNRLKLFLACLLLLLEHFIKDWHEPVFKGVVKVFMDQKVSLTIPSLVVQVSTFHCKIAHNHAWSQALDKVLFNTPSSSDNTINLPRSISAQLHTYYTNRPSIFLKLQQV